MTAIEKAYLALVLVAFAVFSGTMFWGMLTGSSLAETHGRDAGDWRSPHR